MIVVNEETGPAVAPPAFFAVTCQKYVVPLANVAGANAAVVRSVATTGGGLMVPKLTS